MKWHKASEQLPVEESPVLLAWLDKEDGEYSRECMTIAYVTMDDAGHLHWRDVLGYTSIDSTDMWAYPDIPEG